MEGIKLDDVFYKSLISNGPIGYVHLKAIYDELGLVCDFKIVEINRNVCRNNRQK